MVLLLAVAAAVYAASFVIEDILVKALCGIAAALVFTAWTIFAYKKLKRLNLRYSPAISRFVLISGGSEYEREWHCAGEVSFLIGNAALGAEADIDLGDTKYSEYVSGEHAALNRQDRYWYVEDLGSEHGTGLKKRDSDLVVRLKPFTPSKIDEGDIIYIAKTKILVR